SKNGKLIIEGITPEFKTKIQNLVKGITSQGTLWHYWSKTIKLKVDEKIIDVLHQELAIPVKQGDPFFLDILGDYLNFGSYKIEGGKIHARLEFDNIEEAKEDWGKMKAAYPQDEVLTPEEFAKKYPEKKDIIEEVLKQLKGGGNG
ncbi:hypothetical protein DRN43_06695, partial [Thermococci archaeon]